MYMGVKNHHSLPRVTGYEEAQKALEVWNSKPRRDKQIIQVLEQDDGIAFRLYQTDVVVWQPDNSVLIDNYGTATTSGFAQRFLPGGINLNYPVERRGSSGGHNTISFHDGCWENSGVCQGDVVRFVAGAEGWTPDEDTCDTIRLPLGTDRKASRELSKRYHLRDFETWLSMAPMHLGDVEHDEWDLDECLDALEKRDFRRAAEHLPLIKEPSGFGTAERMKPLPIVAPWGHMITMGSLAKLKLAMWEDESLLNIEERKVWDRRTFERGMARIQEMAALGLSTHRLGPS